MIPLPKKRKTNTEQLTATSNLTENTYGRAIQLVARGPNQAHR